MKILVLLFVLLGFVLTFVLFVEQATIVPVQGATHNDWNPEAYWHGSWGTSGVHKGIDVFADKGTPVHAANSGIVLYRGQRSLGGNVVIVAGPGWKIHYYAHLDTLVAKPLRFVRQGALLGTVGQSGNAQDKAAHLHYSIMSLIPSLSRYSSGPQGWKRMFYRNPNHYLPQE